MFVFVHRKPTHPDQYILYNCHHQTGCKEIAVFSLFDRAYSIITNKASVKEGWISRNMEL